MELTEIESLVERVGFFIDSKSALLETLEIQSDQNIEVFKEDTLIKPWNYLLKEDSSVPRYSLKSLDITGFFTVVHFPLPLRTLDKSLDDSEISLNAVKGVLYNVHVLTNIFEDITKYG